MHTLPPYEQANGTDWYKGTANAIYQNISFIDSYDPEYVIILSGDQICKQDYADFLRFHKEKGAEFSVAVMEVDWKEASRFGLMVADEDDKITEFQEKPPVPKSNLASMGIYIFNWDVLKKYLIEDEADPNSKNDFGMNIIPALLRDGRECWGESKPCWELEAPKSAERTEICCPDNPAQLLTLQSRRLLLHRTGENVDGFCLLGGDFFPLDFLQPVFSFQR